MSASYIARLQATRDELLELQARLARGMLRQWSGMDAWARSAVVESMAQNRHQIDCYARQVAWERHLAGEKVVPVPAGPAWRN